MNEAVIRERGYQAYTGPTQPSVRRVLAFHTARTLLARKGVRRSITLACVPALIVGVIAFVAQKAGAGDDAGRVANLLTRPWGTFFPALIIALIAAGGTLAEDRRAGALSFYFARPVVATDYVLGRLTGTAVVVALASVGPPLAVALLHIVQADAQSVMRALVSFATIAVLGTALSVLLAAYALLGGALAGSRGGAQGFLALAVLVPWVAAGVMANLVDGPWISLLSLPHIIESIAHALIVKQAGLGSIFAALSEQSEPTLPPAWMAAIALVVLAAATGAALYQRIDKLAHAGGDA